MKGSGFETGIAKRRPDHRVALVCLGGFLQPTRRFGHRPALQEDHPQNMQGTGMARRGAQDLLGPRFSRIQPPLLHGRLHLAPKRGRRRHQVIDSRGYTYGLAPG